MKLRSENVHQIFMFCLFEDSEATKDHMIGEGLGLKVGFHPQRLLGNKPQIIEMLSQLPISFQQSHGGGMSFLKMGEDKEGNLWTDSQKIMNELVMMGFALGLVYFPAPRMLWSSLPGGVPYICVID